MNGLKKARKLSGLTQDQAALQSGIALGTLRRWEQGKNEPDIESINLLADLYHVSTDLILSSKFADRGAVLVSNVTMPVFGRISAGTPKEALLQSDTTHWVSPELAESHPHAFWLTVSGNSMNRLFPDGSLVLIDPDEEVRNGDVAVVFVNGDDATLKRIYHEGDSIRLHPESYDPEYRDRVIDATDPDAPEVRVIGKAVSYTAPDGWRA